MPKKPDGKKGQRPRLGHGPRHGVTSRQATGCGETREGAVVGQIGRGVGFIHDASAVLPQIEFVCRMARTDVEREINGIGRAHGVVR